MMDASVPREEWPSLIRPFHYEDYESRKGRPSAALETILRMYFLQVWLTLPDVIDENASMA